MEGSYKETEMTLYKYAAQLEQCEKSDLLPGSEKRLRQLNEIQDHIRNQKFRMAVVGEFNRGKSSFINVLLGRRILPEDVLATTATINRITYGEKPRALIVMHDPDVPVQEVPVDQLKEYITKLTAESARTASLIREAVVEYPTMLCFNDVDIIDTPGMNDMDDMNAVTVGRLEDIDLAVVAINAQYPFSETETSFTCRLLESRNICQIIFVITYIDALRPRERQKMLEYLTERIRTRVWEELSARDPLPELVQKYHSIFDNPKLFGVSSRDAMDALETNDMELYEKSGYLRFNRELPQK